MKKIVQNIMQWRGAGDAVAAVAKPIARTVDKIAGTNLQNCGGCKNRQDKLNQAIHFKKP